MGDEGMPIEAAIKVEPEVTERHISVSNSSNTENELNVPKEKDEPPEGLRNTKNPFSRSQTGDVTDYFVRSIIFNSLEADAKTLAGWTKRPRQAFEMAHVSSTTRFDFT